MGAAKRTWRSDARASPQVAATLRRLGRRIRALRVEAELTQELAAERARLDYKHFQAIEPRASRPIWVGFGWGFVSAAGFCPRFPPYKQAKFIEELADRVFGATLTR